jgi:hypothetical protein
MTPDNGQRLAHRIVSLHCGVSPAIEGIVLQNSVPLGELDQEL